MPKIHRNSHASDAAEAFLKSQFQAPGIELSMGELQKRAFGTKIDASGSAVNTVAIKMAKDGDILKVARGVYRSREPQKVFPPAVMVPHDEPKGSVVLPVTLESLDAKLDRVLSLFRRLLDPEA